MMNLIEREKVLNICKLTRKQMNEELNDLFLPLDNLDKYIEVAVKSIDLVLNTIEKTIGYLPVIPDYSSIKCKNCQYFRETKSQKSGKGICKIGFIKKTVSCEDFCSRGKCKP